MARPPKPWWRAERQEYCVVIRGIMHRLGPNKKEADRKFHELMAKPPEEPQRLENSSVAGIMDLFLQDCQIECAEETYLWYRKHCQAFLDYLKSRGLSRLLVAELRPHHVEELPCLETQMVLGHEEWGLPCRTTCFQLGGANGAR